MAPPVADPAKVCPVDHKTRQAWLAQAKVQNAATPPASPHEAAPASTSTPLATPASCDSSQMDNTPSFSSSAPSTASILGSTRLGTMREVSTIPRALSPTGADPAARRPANNEKDTGADKKTGNWIYPSEQMFFEAMKRKAYDPDGADMKTIVPIHNAVNERAWKEIKQWERGRGAEAYVPLIRTWGRMHC